MVRLHPDTPIYGSHPHLRPAGTVATIFLRVRVRAAMYLPAKQETLVRFQSVPPNNAPLAKLADALDLESSSERSAGSMPVWGTKFNARLVQ